MKVILTEKVSSLGNVGEVVNVSAGYARNYLIPGKLAVVADESNRAQMDHMNRSLAKKMEAQKDEALGLKKKIDGLKIEMIKRVGANGKLFGTVTNGDLSKELEGKGIEIERRLLIIENPIKALGTFGVRAKLFKGVEANFEVKVAIDPKQAEEMKAKEAEAAAEKKRKEEEAKAKKEAGEVEGEGEKKEQELTEDQKLNLEAQALLRG